MLTLKIPSMHLYSFYSQWCPFKLFPQYWAIMLSTEPTVSPLMLTIARVNEKNYGFGRSNDLPKVMNPVVTGWVVMNMQICFIPEDPCNCRVIRKTQLCAFSNSLRNPQDCFAVLYKGFKAQFFITATCRALTEMGYWFKQTIYEIYLYKRVEIWEWTWYNTGITNFLRYLMIPWAYRRMPFLGNVCWSMLRIKCHAHNYKCLEKCQKHRYIDT